MSLYDPLYCCNSSRFSNVDSPATSMKSLDRSRIVHDTTTAVHSEVHPPLCTSILERHCCKADKWNPMHSSQDLSKFHVVSSTFPNILQSRTILQTLQPWPRACILLSCHMFCVPAISMQACWCALHVSVMANLRHPNVGMFMSMCWEPPCNLKEICAWSSLFDVLGKAQITQ